MRATRMARSARVAAGGVLAPVGTVVLAAALTLSTVVAVGATAAHATTTGTTVAPRFSYQASGYGTQVAVGSLVTSGASALMVLGCTTQAGLHVGNTAVAKNLSPLLTSGTAAITGDTFASPVAARTTATTTQINLLSGLVHGSAVRAQSTTTHSSTGFTLSSAGTSFTNLVVAGVPITAAPSANTRINLPGFGYVVLNEQQGKVTTSSAGLTVNAVHLFITTTNVLGIKTGTTVVISHATSGLGGPVAGLLGGVAYGSSATVGTVVKAGQSFPAYMPCLGTGGVLRTNPGLSVTIPKLLTTGTIADTVRGTITATSATGELTSTVQSANVLASLVRTSVVKVDAHASTNGATFPLSDAGSSFGTLSVTGFPAIHANTAPNTTLAVPGVGTLYLHRVIRSTRSIEVRMIELVLTKPVNGLAIGTDLRVAVAVAAVR